MTPNVKACCCGHMRWEHRDGGDGSCRICGGISCPKYHDVGEGHPSPLFILFVVALLTLAAWGVWQIHRRMTAQAIFDFFSQEEKTNAALPTA